jgi:hypothetical protein
VSLELKSISETEHIRKEETYMLYDCKDDAETKQELQKSNEQLIEEFTKSDWFYFSMGAFAADCSIHNRPQPTDAELRQAVIEEHRTWIEALRVCMDKGHDWACESHCGPDSGSETLTCKRCREAHTITYY